jgi:hypothetical protein
VNVAGADLVFVIRTWFEAPQDARTMRGRVDHSASGRRRYFSNFGELCDFIATVQDDSISNRAGDAARNRDR